jgi:hypothetical protein
LECGFFLSITGFEKVELSYRLDNYLRSIDYAGEGRGLDGFVPAGNENFVRLPVPGRMHYGTFRISF